DGDSVLDSVSSTVIGEALGSGAGRVECLVLPHRYEHLSPLVNLIDPSSRGAEKWAEKVEQKGEQPPASSRPPFVRGPWTRSLRHQPIERVCQRRNTLTQERVAVRDARDIRRRFVPPLTAVPRL